MKFASRRSTTISYTYENTITISSTDHDTTTMTSFTAGNDKIFYSDNSGNVTELALGDSV